MNIHPQSFAKAVRAVKPSPELKDRAYRVLVEGVPTLEVFERDAPNAERDYQVLVDLFKHAVAPTEQPVFTQLQLVSITTEFRYIKYWVFMALSLVLVDGYGMSQVGRLLGMSRQQVNIGVTKAKEKALFLGILDDAPDLETITVQIPKTVAKQVKDYEHEFASATVKEGAQKRPVFAILNNEDAEKVERFIADLTGVKASA
ncbi:hypothetical protein SAMN04487868_11628 [Marinobacter salarius]|uniref:Uncharacterized protein n=1 Tax=Marinobacter salarius TaxID=1420917 RepID=A0ABY1FRJ8_9GAMM|nr:MULTISPECIES: hypothetical protein [Marinobacter]KXJ44963.1 MAG: hypothetical protein AXW11_14330 [Marinobacter sp. Hex_13]SFL93596.1 hypothetical protein SAMN04487868_11628 [Marinobacter salarius]